MIAEIGHFALILAALLAVLQSTLPLWGAALGNAALMDSARSTALGQFGMTAVAFAALTYCYVVSDFSVINVMQNSHSEKPMLYKITGVWGNHEGSMVLWVMVLALFGALVALFGRNLPPTLRARTLAVQGMIGLGFLAFILLTSNPFIRVFPPPLDGQDLNPLLQDPGLAFHPPMLYLGYVGFSVAYSFAIAALIEGRVDPAWARQVRPWTLAAWVFLTLGIGLGSWWAYYELGWGGWWYWDPVENASFMPWLLGTALLHSAIVVEKRDALKSWTILLAILTFSLSLMGTFLVRSGVLTSVHAFAVDPERGVFILALMAIATGGGLALYAWRAPQLNPGGVFKPVSREGALVINNLLLATATAVVFVGTLYPLFLDAVTGEKVSVGPPWFNATFLPLMVPLIAAMAVGPMLAWKRADLGPALERLKWAGLFVLFVLTIMIWAVSETPLWAFLGLGMAAWAFGGAVAEFAERVRLGRVRVRDSMRRAGGLPRAAWGMMLAHAGLGIAILGMTASSIWMQEKIQVMRPGEVVEMAGYEIEMLGVEQETVANYDADRAIFRVTRDGEFFAIMRPEKRWFPVQQMVTTEAAIHTTFFSDVYLVLGDPDANVTETGAWATRFYYYPGVPWIWYGTILMSIGGLVSLSDRRLRVGVAKRRETAAPPASTAEATA